MKSKEQLRTEAEERQAARAALTPQQQMARVRTRRGDSIRERERLIEQIENGQGHVVSSKKKGN